MGKFTRELLRRIESKVCSSPNVEVNASNVSNIPPTYCLSSCWKAGYMDSRNSSRMERKRIPSFQDMPILSSYNMAPGLRQHTLERDNQF